jgi:drug/metabolite transporter (DMT)-like permease
VSLTDPEAAIPADPPAPAEAAVRPGRALLWMCGAIASFSLMVVSARTAQAEINSFQLMAWRSLIGFVVVVALLAVSRGGFAQVRSRHPGLHLGRNLLHFAGQNLWFYGILMIPLSQIVALEFTSPIWVALLAPLILGESLTRAKLLAALVGFAGVLVVAQPGIQPVGLGHAAGLAAAVFFALNMIYTKRIMAHDTVLCVMFWMTLLQGIMGFGVGLATGMAWPSAAIWPSIAIVGLTGLSAHYSITSALSHAPASLVAPMEFLRLPVISVIGVMVYAEALDPWVFVGAALIFAGNWINLRASRPARARS